MEPHLIVELLMQYLDRQPENDKLRIRLYMALRQAILDRALAQGVKLPPTRVLAADLRLGRNTVVRAYEQLLVEGYLEGRVGDGTYVSDVVDAASKPAAPRRLIGTRREGLSRRGRTIVNSAASSVIQNGAFMPGVPDVEQFPGHIACDSRSNSEIVVPVRDAGGEIIGVFDADSKEKGSFDLTDAFWLEKIMGLISLPAGAL